MRKIIYISLFILVASLSYSQSYNLGNCQWNLSTVPSGGTAKYCVTLGALGSGSSNPPRVTFQGPSGADSDGWILSTASVNTDMKGTWTFSEILGAFSANYSGAISDGDYAVICVDAKHDGSSTELGSNSSNVSPGGSTCNSAISAAPSPVTLIGFDAEAQGIDAVLTWSTSSEENNDRFIVEYSLDGGKTYEQAASVRGAGTTSTRTDYSYVHEGIGRIQTKGVYYRLIQVDYDGGSETLPVRFVEFPLGAYALYPSPVFKGTNMTLDAPYSGSVSYTIFDARGAVVEKRTTVDRSIHTDHLESGSYKLVIDNKNVTLPFIVVR